MEKTPYNVVYAEKLLYEQLELLAERSKKCKPDELFKLSLAMAKIFSEIKNY